MSLVPMEEQGTKLLRPRRPPPCLRGRGYHQGCPGNLVGAQARAVVGPGVLRSVELSGPGPVCCPGGSEAGGSWGFRPCLAGCRAAVPSKPVTSP